MDPGSDGIEGGFFGGVQGIRGVIAGFRVEIGLDLEDFLSQAGAGEDEGGIDKTETSQGVGAVFGDVQGAAFAFEQSDGFITVYGDDQDIAQGGGFFQIV